MIHAMIDIDDVLFPWADSIHQRAHIAGLHDGTKPYSSWSMWEDYGCSKEAWLEVVDKATADGMYHEPPMPGQVEALRRLWWEGVQIHLVTARGFMAYADEIRAWTHDWVEEFAVPHHTLSFAKDKVAEQAVLGVRFDYAIDDGVHNFVALREDGIRALLVDRPHNQNLKVAWHPYGERITGMDDFANIILKEVA